MSEERAPIACCLGPEEFEERRGQWQALVASSVESLEVEPTTLRLALEGSDGALVRAAELGRLEKACCPFFDISIDLGAETRTLTVRVPEGAEEVLDAFVAMLRA